MPTGLAIRALRARTPAGAQPVAARLALQTLGADLEDALPRGLPPQSLLWLRRLQLQAPEGALLRPAPAAWRQVWIAAGRQQFDAALAQAARPALGPMPASAPAVLFADAAEMLACLALAAQAGQLDRWWWRGLLGRAWPQWQTAWVARPEAQSGARRLLARLAPGPATDRGPGQRLWAELDRLAAAAVAAHDADDTAVAIEPRGAISEVAVQPASALASGAAVAATGPSAGAPPAAMPTCVLPPTPAIESALDRRAAPTPADSTAADAPVRAVTGAMEPVSREAEAAQLAQPQRLEKPASARMGEPGDAPALRAPRPVRRHRDPAQSALPSAQQCASSPAPEPEVRPQHAVPAAGPMPLLAAAASAPRPGADVPPRPSPEPPLPPVPVSRSGPPAAQAPTAPRPAAPIDEAPGAWPWPEALLSRQAPLLFIVNALLEDGLYPDFTRPRDPGLPVPLWALLAALCRAWRLPVDDALQAALARRCPDWIAPEAMPHAPGVAAAPWASWLAAYARCLRRRLCRRLGRRASAWPAALTLTRPARLWLSEAEWVVEFDLETHDVAWRLAGLDRDPGWLPSAGCTLRFEFVC